MKARHSLALVSDRARPAPRITPLSATPQIRGYCPHYVEGETNRCPGCGGTAWIVGRFSAECPKCGAALPMAQAGRT